MTSKDDEFDAAAWVARLKQSGLEHARVVERRPDAQEVSSSLRALGTHLYAWTDVSREMACAAAGLDPGATYRWVPSPGSIAAADAAALSEPVATFCDSENRLSTHWLPTNPTRNPTDWGIEFLSRCIRTATECITAMGTLLDAGEHLRAPLILARSCIEAMATACYVVDATVDQRERTRRVLNLHLAQIKESQLESLALQSSDDQDEETELRELMAFATYLGYSIGGISGGQVEAAGCPR